MWIQYLHDFYPGLGPCLPGQSHKQRLALFGNFAVFIREGSYRSKPGRVGCEQVKVALRAVASSFILDGQPNPMVTPERRYYLPLARQLKYWTNQDPAPRPQLALPISALHHIRRQRRKSNTHKDRALADLCIVAWYYLLRVGEYTYKDPSLNTQTTPFTVGDITLWSRNETILDPTLPEAQLLRECHAATFQLDNSKTGARNETIHHIRLPNDQTCPVAAIVRRLSHIYQHTQDETTIISAYYATPFTLKRHVTTSHVNTFLKKAVSTIPNFDIPKARISSHSLRAGGAVAMHNSGISQHTIQIFGRWSSSTFMRYIHTQLSSFAVDLSRRMSTPIAFHNISRRK